VNQQVAGPFPNPQTHKFNRSKRKFAKSGTYIAAEIASHLGHSRPAQNLGVQRKEICGWQNGP
jgi:hypothetical protein